MPRHWEFYYHTWSTCGLNLIDHYHMLHKTVSKRLLQYKCFQHALTWIPCQEHVLCIIRSEPQSASRLSCVCLFLTSEYPEHFSLGVVWVIANILCDMFGRDWFFFFIIPGYRIESGVPALLYFLPSLLYLWINMLICVNKRMNQAKHVSIYV